MSRFLIMQLAVCAAIVAASVAVDAQSNTTGLCGSRCLNPGFVPRPGNCPASCPFCVGDTYGDARCRSNSCAAYCSADADCAGGAGGLCNKCDKQTSLCMIAPQCGAPCTPHANLCPVTCSTCYNAFPGAGVAVCVPNRFMCGQGCSNSTRDCGGTCSACVAGVCIVPGSLKCGTACQGPDECDSKCPICDPFKTMCVAGAQCGGKCRRRVDCDPLTCNKCFGGTCRSCPTVCGQAGAAKPWCMCRGPTQMCAPVQ